MHIVSRDRIASFVTLDGSSIRELAGPARGGGRRQSLAEATVAAGGQTLEHLHRTSEEIYYMVRGRGRMRLGGDESDVAAGDCVAIPPGTRHKLWASPDEDLVLLCACAPAYSDEDTEITEGVARGPA